VRHLPAVSRALRAIVVHIGRLGRSFLRHARKDNLILLGHHADKVEVELVADILLFNNPLLSLWLDIFKRWLILLGALLAVACGLSGAVIGPISFETSHGFPMRLLWLLSPRIRMLTGLLYQTIITVGAV
jgi:hypothetical protein